MNTVWMLLGVTIGAGLALAAKRSPGWVAQHPGTVLAAFGISLACAVALVQIRMSASERRHEQRAEVFRIAMLETFARDRSTTVQ